MHDEHHASGGDDKMEYTDWHMNLVLLAMGVLTVTVLVSFWIGYGFMRSLQERPATSDFESSPFRGEHEEWTGDTRLQSAPWDALVVHQAEHGREATSFGVVTFDESGEKALVFQIPVDIALDIVAEAGRIPTIRPLGLDVAPAAAEAEQGEAH